MRPTKKMRQKPKNLEKNCFGSSSVAGNYLVDYVNAIPDVPRQRIIRFIWRHFSRFRRGIYAIATMREASNEDRITKINLLLAWQKYTAYLEVSDRLTLEENWPKLLSLYENVLKTDIRIWLRVMRKRQEETKT